MHPHGTRIRFHATTSALVAAVALVLTSACGGTVTVEKKSSKDRSTTTTTTTTNGTGGSGTTTGIFDKAGKGSFDDATFDTEVDACLEQSVVKSLGPDAMDTLASVELSEYSAEELDALVRAFNKCVPGSAIARSVTTTFYREAGLKTAPSSAVISCVEKEIDGRTGEIVAEGARSDAGAFPEITITSIDRCVPPADVAALLKQSFLEAGLTEQQAACTSSALEGQVTISDIADAGRDQQSPALQAKVEEAAQSCR